VWQENALFKTLSQSIRYILGKLPMKLDDISTVKSSRQTRSYENVAIKLDIMKIVPTIYIQGKLILQTRY
jgi:hypothetical protein